MYPDLPPPYATVQSAHVVAHRGGSGEWPEDSLYAFAQAVKVGATWSELDVKISRDGVPMVLHDRELRRTTGKDGYFKDLTAAQAQETALLPFAPGMLHPARTPNNWQKQGIPTLAQAFGVADAHYVLDCEFAAQKLAQVSDVLQVAGEVGAQHRMMIASLDPEILAAARELAPNVPRISFLRSPDELQKMLQTARPHAVLAAPEWASQVAPLLPAEVGLWVGLVDQDSALFQATLAGAQTILTNYPSFFITRFSTRGQLEHGQVTEDKTNIGKTKAGPDT